MQATTLIKSCTPVAGGRQFGGSLRACQILALPYACHVLVLVLLVLCSVNGAMGASLVRFHVVDYGIEQPWTKDLRVGDPFRSTDKSMFPDLSKKQGAQILLPMPADDDLKNLSEYDLAKKIATELIKKVNAARSSKEQVSEFEILVLQNINLKGYLLDQPLGPLGDERQELVKKFGRAYTLAIGDLLQSQSGTGSSAEVDFWTGSNGTFALTEAYKVIKQYADKISLVVLIDGRAFVTTTDKFISALGHGGDRKVVISTTRGDAPGHLGDIAWLSKDLDLQKKHEGITVLLLEPKSADRRWLGPLYIPIKSHVGMMINQKAPDSALFNVLQYTGGRKEQLGTLNAKQVMDHISNRVRKDASSGRSPQGATPMIGELPDPSPPWNRRRPDPLPQTAAVPPQFPPPPPPPAVAAAIGGIEYSAEAKLVGDALPEITGLVFDARSQRFILVGRQSYAAPLIREDDLAMALWLVFGPRPADPRFSLDPADPAKPLGKWLKAVYLPEELKGTRWGETMFNGDFAMKQLSFAVKVSESGKVEARTPPVPGFMSVAELILEDVDREPVEKQWARFWIVVEEVVIRLTSDNSLSFDMVKMGVKARHQVPDRASPSGFRDVDTRDDSAEARWARQLSDRFDDVAMAMPNEFGRLKELAKAMAIAKWIKRQGIDVDLAWAVSKLRISTIPATDKVTALSANWTRKEHIPFENKRGAGVRTVTHTLRLFGGVDLTVNPKYAAEHSGDRRLRDKVISTLGKDHAKPIFSLEVDGEVQYAKVLPITATGQAMWRDYLARSSNTQNQR